MYRNKARKTFNDDEADRVWAHVAKKNVPLELKRAPKYTRRILLELASRGLNVEYCLSFLKCITGFIMKDVKIKFDDFDMTEYGVCTLLIKFTCFMKFKSCFFVTE